MADEVRIAKGSQIQIGAPARPLPEEVVQAIRGFIASDDRVIEAHVPQMFIPTAMKSPAQVLVVELRPGCDVKAVVDGIGQQLIRILAKGSLMDVLPLKAESPLLVPIRALKLCVKPRSGGSGQGSSSTTQ